MVDPESPLICAAEEAVERWGKAKQVDGYELPRSTRDAIPNLRQAGDALAVLVPQLLDRISDLESGMDTTVTIARNLANGPGVMLLLEEVENVRAENERLREQVQSTLDETTSAWTRDTHALKSEKAQLLDQLAASKQDRDDMRQVRDQEWHSAEAEIGRLGERCRQLEKELDDERNQHALTARAKFAAERAALGDTPPRACEGECEEMMAEARREHHALHPHADTPLVAVEPPQPETPRQCIIHRGPDQCTLHDHHMGGHEWPSGPETPATFDPLLRKYYGETDGNVTAREQLDYVVTDWLFGFDGPDTVDEIITAILENLSLVLEAAAEAQRVVECTDPDGVVTWGLPVTPQRPPFVPGSKQDIVETAPPRVDASEEAAPPPRRVVEPPQPETPKERDK